MKFIEKIIPLILSVCFLFTLASCNVDVGENITKVKNVNTTINVSTQTASENNAPLVEILDYVRPSVVEVYATTKSGKSAGSGVVYSIATDSENVKTYYVLTCHHVIEGGTQLSVKDIEGREFKAHLIGGDAQSDIAVIAMSSDVNNFEDANLSACTIRASEDGEDYVKVGEEVVAIGNPLGTLGGTVTRGIISSVDRPITVEGKKMTLIQTDCAINSGNSGGALYSVSGQLVGIVNAGYSGSVEGLNFAIPANYAMEIANGLLSTYHTNNENYGYVVGRAKITVADVTNVFWAVDTTGYDMFFTTKTANNIYYTALAYVDEDSVYSENLSVGNVITSVKYQEKSLDVTTASSLVNFIASIEFTAGQTITFTVKDSANALESKTVNVVIPQYVYNP